MKNTTLTLLIVGIFNSLHGILHVIQFLQSVILATNNHSHSGFFENPIWNFIWAIIGILTLIIGIKDWRHHKNCKHIKN